jgi:CRISPR-associated exonuclease Cas4
VNIQRTCERIPLLAKRLGVFRYDYTLVDCGSKDNIPLYAQLLNKFKIPYVAVYDLDHQAGKSADAIASADKSTQLVEASLDKGLGVAVVLTNDIEEEVGLLARSKSKPYVALTHVSAEGFAIPAALEEKVRRIYLVEQPKPMAVEIQ